VGNPARQHPPIFMRVAVGRGKAQERCEPNGASQVLGPRAEAQGEWAMPVSPGEAVQDRRPATAARGRQPAACHRRLVSKGEVK
jgi:hypothetical protein